MIVLLAAPFIAAERNWSDRMYGSGTASNSLDDSRTHSALTWATWAPFHAKSPAIQSEWEATLKGCAAFSHVALALPTKALSENDTSFVIFVCWFVLIPKLEGNIEPSNGEELWC